MPSQCTDVGELHETQSSHEQYAGQRGHRDEFEHRSGREHERRDPQAVHDRGRAGAGAGGDVGGGAHDHARDRHPAECTGDGVGGTLADEFAIEIAPGAAMKLVDGNGRQQRLERCMR